MVWHGGLSGSIPLKIAEKNHFSEIKDFTSSESESEHDSEYEYYSD